MFMASGVDLPAHTGQDILILCLHILWGHCMYVIRVYIDCITQGNDDDDEQQQQQQQQHSVANFVSISLKR